MNSTPLWCFKVIDFVDLVRSVLADSSSCGGSLASSFPVSLVTVAMILDIDTTRAFSAETTSSAWVALRMSD